MPLTLALVAHDRMKPALAAWVTRHAAELAPHALVCTATTGGTIRQQCPDLPIRLVKSGPLKLRLNAPSRWLGQLKTGLAFEVAIEETGKRYPARVSAVNSRVDSVSQTVELEATLAGSYPELLPGMSGTAVFPPR